MHLLYLLKLSPVTSKGFLKVRQIRILIENLNYVIKIPYGRVNTLVSLNCVSNVDGNRLQRRDARPAISKAFVARRPRPIDRISCVHPIVTGELAWPIFLFLSLK